MECKRPSKMPTYNYGDGTYVNNHTLIFTQKKREK